MHAHNASKPSNLAGQLSLLDYWSTSLQPLLPLLADETQMAIGHLNNVLPDFLKVIVLKLSTALTQEILDNHFLASGPHTSRRLDNWLSNLPIAENLNQHGCNFQTLATLSTQSPALFDQLFDDETQTIILAGVLLEKTQLPLDKLLTTWQMLTALTLASLADIIAQLHPQITTMQMVEWLIRQPAFFVVPSDSGMMNAVNYQANVSFRALQQQQQVWRTSDHLADLPPHQQQIIRQLQTQQRTNLFSIAPVNLSSHNNLPAITISNTNAASQHHAVKFTQPQQAKNNTIFAKPAPSKPLSWIDQLQKNWIATAIALSAVVFGGVGSLMTVKDKPAATSATAELSSPKPLYQDVAIVNVGSATNQTPQTVIKPTHQHAPSKPTHNKILQTSSRQPDTRQAGKKTAANHDEHKKSPDNPDKKIKSKQKNSQPLTQDNKKTTTAAAKKTPVSTEQSTNKDKGAKTKSTKTAEKASLKKRTDKNPTNKSSND